MSQEQEKTKKQQTECLLQILLNKVGSDELQEARERHKNQQGGLFFKPAQMESTDGLRQCTMASWKVYQAMLEEGCKNMCKGSVRSALNKLNKVHDGQLFASVKNENWAIRQCLNHIRYTDSRVVSGTRLPNHMQILLMSYRRSMGKESAAIVLATPHKAFQQNEKRSCCWFCVCFISSSDASNLVRLQLLQMASLVGD